MLDFTPWTPEENDRLRELLAQGRTREQIAEVLGRTASAVGRRRVRMNIKSRLNPFPWTEEATADLKRLWLEETKSATAVAVELGEKYNHPLTRNAIIGKVDRLGIGRAEPRQYKSIRIRMKSNKLRRQPLPKLVWAAPEPLNGIGIKFSELAAHHCRFISGSPSGLETVFCGAPKHGDSPYCGPHDNICHRA
jgi:hypothetical protein